MTLPATAATAAIGGSLRVLPPQRSGPVAWEMDRTRMRRSAARLRKQIEWLWERGVPLSYPFMVYLDNRLDRLMVIQDRCSSRSWFLVDARRRRRQRFAQNAGRLAGTRRLSPRATQRGARW